MKTKIAFFDIDGTLLGIGEKKPSEKTLEALSRLRKRGVKLCIATGRAPLSLPEFARTSGFDAFITFNGSFCFDEKGTIFSNPLSPEDIRLVTNNAGRIGRPVSVATRDRFAANGVDDDMRDYYSISRMTIKPSPDFDSLIESEEVFQMMLGARKDEYEELMRGVSHAAVAAWWDRAVDIIPSGGGKGKAVEKILEHYGYDKAQSIAFGDGDNDIEMLKAAGCGVAMANASDKLKAVADEVCPSVCEDGIYHYCLEHGLI